MKIEFPIAKPTNYQVWSKTTGKWKLTRQGQGVGRKRVQKYTYTVDGVDYDTAGEATGNLGIAYHLLFNRCQSKSKKWATWIAKRI